MKEVFKKHKPAFIIGIIVIIIALAVGIVLIATRNGKPGPDNNVQNEQNQTDDTQTPTEDEGEEEESGGIIVEDTSPEEDNSNEEDESNNGSFELGQDQDIQDMLDKITESDEEIFPLSQETIDRINNDIFRNEEACYWPNMFLGTYYSCPEEIDLGDVFYMGLRDGEITVSEDEYLKVEAIYGDIWSSIHKMPADKMEEIIKKYTGLSLDAYKEQLNQQFVYLEEYDAYYGLSSDVHYYPHIIESGYYCSNGEIVLLYRTYAYASAVTVSNELWIQKATVKEKENGDFLFISNEPYGVSKINDVNGVISDWEEFDYIGTVDSYELSSGKLSLQSYSYTENNRGPIYANLTSPSIEELEVAEDCEIIVSVEFDPFYLTHEAMEFLQDRNCFKDKIFFVIVEDGKIVKMIDRAILRIWL